MADYSNPLEETPAEAYRRTEQELYDLVSEKLQLGFDGESDVTSNFIDAVRAIIKATR
jgi:hypothetical protein